MHLKKSTCTKPINLTSPYSRTDNINNTDNKSTVQHDQPFNNLWYYELCNHQSFSNNTPLAIGNHLPGQFNLKTILISH